MKLRRSSSLVLVLLVMSPLYAGERSGSRDPEILVVVGAGYQPPWDTEFALANPGSDFVQAAIHDRPHSLSPCLICPEWGGLLVPGGTARATAQSALLGVQYSGSPGVRTLYVDARMGLDAPVVTARLVNRERQAQAADLPVIRYSTIEALNPTVLAFPSATRGSNSHTNLVLAEVSYAGDLSGVVQAFSSAGDLLGTSTFAIDGSQRTLFLIDVLEALGVSALENGQIRVTKTGGSGLMWGVVATVYDDGRVTVSSGLNP